MVTWIALFRGINVGGNNSLPMKSLVALLEREGFDAVRTYIQSGNVVFRSAARAAAPLAARIGAAVHASHGFQPQIMLLTAAELVRAAAANPFAAATAAPQTLHLYFLAASPRAADIAALDKLRAGQEAFELKGQVFYLHTPDGFGTSKLAASVERLLRVAATARNWRTVNALLDMTKAE